MWTISCKFLIYWVGVNTKFTTWQQHHMTGASRCCRNIDSIMVANVEMHGQTDPFNSTKKTFLCHIMSPIHISALKRTYCYLPLTLKSWQKQKRNCSNKQHRNVLVVITAAGGGKSLVRKSLATLYAWELLYICG